MNLGIQSTYW